MTTRYIISQIFVVFAMLCLGLSYVTKDKKNVMILCVFCSFFYASQYFLLNAFTGVAMNIISIGRNIWFYITNKQKKKNSLFSLIFLFVIIILFTIITYDNLASIVSMIATLIFTYSVWQDNTKVYRYLSLPISFSWITYNICYRSIFGVVAELVLLSFEITGIIKINKEIQK